MAVDRYTLETKMAARGQVNGKSQLRKCSHHEYAFNAVCSIQRPGKQRFPRVHQRTARPVHLPQRNLVHVSDQSDGEPLLLFFRPGVDGVPDPGHGPFGC